MNKIGGYEIIEKIGTGGMGTVYRGRQVSLDRPVAIKVLSRKLTDSEELRDRFRREAQIIAKLNHPNIIHVIDRGVTSNGMPYFVMEHVEGKDLSAKISAGDLDVNRKLELSIQICKALSYAHKNGVIHRDIKPANVLIDNDGNALVLDFGIAKLSDNGCTKSAQTQASLVMGTIEYMSPEQRTEARSVTAASDLYSLGALMYELFTGVKPLGRFRPPSKIDPSISPALETIILRCLEPDPADRFSSADDVKDGLLRVLQGGHLPSALKERANTGLSSGGKFALLDVIKEDDFGAVYLYQDKVDQRLLIIKKRTKTTAGLSEAKILNNLKHKHVINILGASGDEHLFIVVMEYLSGGSLKDRLVRPYSWIQTIKIGRQIASGLSFAHRNRVIHGNLRPSNILFTETGEVKLTDFGLDEHYSGEDGKNWYRHFPGSKSYPADIFAAGVIFYEMATGLLPTWKENDFVPDDSFNLLPLPLQKMIRRMISVNDKDRFQSFDEVLVEMDALITAWEEKKKRMRDDQMRKKKAEPVSLPPQKSANWRLLQTLLLLVLLVAAALVYLQQTGYTDMYVDEMVVLWRKIAASLSGFLR